jgi:serine O-acetyltransferase
VTDLGPPRAGSDARHWTQHRRRCERWPSHVLAEALKADIARRPRGDTSYGMPELSTKLIRLALDPGGWAVVEYRFRHYWTSKPGLIGKVATVLTILSKKLIEVTSGISIANAASFGPGLHIVHFSGIFVDRDVVAGRQVTICQGVTIGETHLGSPRIGNRVYIGPGAKVLGRVALGDDVVVGANAVVVHDIPAESLALGVPAVARPRVSSGEGVDTSEVEAVK